MPYGAVFKGSITSSGVGLLLLLGVLDYLWGEYVFDCPCNRGLSGRRMYCMAFIVIPNLAILSLDVRWRLCLSLPLVQWLVIIRILARALLLTSLWVLFCFMEKKFVTCFREPSWPCCVETQTDCIEEEKEGSASIRFWVTVTVMILAIVIAGLAFCVAMAAISPWSCCKTCARKLLVRCERCDGCCCVRKENPRQISMFAEMSYSHHDYLNGGVKMLQNNNLLIPTALKIYDEGLMPMIGKGEGISSDSMNTLKSRLPCAEYEKLKAVNMILGNSQNQTVEESCRGQTIKKHKTDDREQLVHVSSSGTAQNRLYSTFPQNTTEV